MTTLVPTEMLADYDSTALLSVLPIGTVLPYAGAAVPTPDAVATFLFCDGALLDRSAYPTLFARLGTAYNTGGESGTKFRLPDLRGRVPVGQDDMGGTTAGRITSGVSGIDGTVLGASGGDQRLHAHSHGVNDPGHSHAITGGQGANNIGADDSGMVEGVGQGGALTASTQVTGITTQVSGAGSGQNLQPLQIVNYIIRAL